MEFMYNLCYNIVGYFINKNICLFYMIEFFRIIRSFCIQFLYIYRDQGFYFYEVEFGVESIQQLLGEGRILVRYDDG